MQQYGFHRIRLNRESGPRKVRKKKPEATPPDRYPLRSLYGLMQAAKQLYFFSSVPTWHAEYCSRGCQYRQRKPSPVYSRCSYRSEGCQFLRRAFATQSWTEAGRISDGRASTISRQFAFWQKELLKSGPQAHAIVHSKIVVIDPLTPNCVVITGSHNLGYQASYNNDENLLIVHGEQELARAYAVNIMDVSVTILPLPLQQKHHNAFRTEPSDAWQKNT